MLDVVDQTAVVAEPPLHGAAFGAHDVDLGGVGLACALVLHRVALEFLRGSSACRRSSRTTISRPLLRKAYSRNRLEIVSREYVVVSKIVLGGPVGHRGAGVLARLHRAHLLERTVRDADREALAPLVATVAHLDHEVAGQGVDDRDTDAVQTAGDLVAAAAELAAGVQHGQRHRDRRHAPGREPCRSGCRGRCPRPGRRRRPCRVTHDPVAVAGQRLVDGVVDDLADQVVQAALAGGADVHARALAHRLEALEHLDRDWRRSDRFSERRVAEAALRRADLRGSG